MGRTRRIAGVLGAAVTLFFALTQATPQPSRIHEQLTSDELRHIFHVEQPDLVPEYHLVQLTHHLSRRHVPSSHPANHLNHGSSKVPHEKTSPTKDGTKYRSPSLLNDEMVYNSKFDLKDVDIFGELNDELPIVIGDENVESEIKSKTAETKPESARKGSAVSDTKESGSDSKVSQSASEQDLSDEEHVSEMQDDGTHRINLEAFGKQLELVLKKQNSLLKKDGLRMWSAVSNDTHPHGVEYLEMHSDDDEDIGELFHDEKSGAALLIRREPKNGKLMVEGSIGHDLVIKPLPPSVTAPPEDDEMFLEPASMADMVSIDTGLPIRRAETERERLRRALAGAQHVIYRRTTQQTEDEMSDYAFMEPDHLAKRYRRRRSAEEAHSRDKREAPYVIYPEILVIVDYDGYRLHGGDNVQIKRYFVSFWNGVDLRYKLLKGPRIRISIAGIIISRARDATPYLEKNRVGRDAIDSAAALTDMGKYLFRERKLPVYDIAVAITKYDMCRRRKGGRCTKGTAGFAYVGGACVVNKRLEKVNSVAIIEDTGGFSGIIVAAHEVGHLLGAVHDGSPPPSYLGGPGAEKCRWEDGFIMSDLRHTEKGFRWSSCSVQSFHHFLNGDTATCLYNSPHEDDSLPRVLPGRLLTLDAQCRKDRGTSACFKDERVCAQLFCFDASSGYCVAYRPAAEGSPCGDGQYCINGRCIAEHENIIPDYSQHTPSYVRRDTSPFYGTNATSYEETTQPYQESEPPSTKNYYKYNVYQTSSTAPPQTYAPYTKPTTNIYQTSNQPQTTVNPFKYFYQTHSTTKNPYDFRHYNNVVETQSTSYPSSYASTQHTYVYNKYSITSTKSPYDFNDYATTRKVKPFKPNEVTTNDLAVDEKTSEKPKRFGFYNKYDFNNFFNRTTTKNPYNFAFDSKFGFNNNNIKPLYKIGTYYNQQKDENSVGPDASNRRSVEIEPARLVYSFQTNATALLSSRSHRTSQIAAATNGK